MLNELVDGGDRPSGCGEHVAPSGERAVGREGHAALLVALGDQLEKHAGHGLVLSDIRDVVEDEQVVTVELGPSA